MLRAPRSAVLVILGLVLSFGGQARAQDATASAFTLQNFRPAVDSKGYVTVNASQILGHLDFSLGLVGSYANNVLNLRGNGNAEFNVEHLMTPQLQFAIGLFKWVELGVSLPVQIMFGNRHPEFKDPTNDTNQNNQLSFSGQFVGDIGLHVKARFLNTSKYPVGLGLLFSLVCAVGRLEEVPRRRPGHAAARAHRRQGVRLLAPLQDGAQRRRAHPSVDALVHRRRHDPHVDPNVNDGMPTSAQPSTMLGLAPAAIPAAARSRRARSARSSPTGSACRTPSCPTSSTSSVKRSATPG